MSFKVSSLDLALASTFAALTGIGAYVMIPLPFTPIPVTLQTFFTLLSGVVLGGFRGFLSQLIYVCLGCIGLPVFAGGKAGLPVLLGPTGGYILGFIVSAYIVGRLNELRRNAGFTWVFASTIIGNLVIYLFGLFQLMFWLGITFVEAVIVGVLPFIFGDVVKAFFASVVGLRIVKIFPRLKK
ncbi:MAG: biotin transporter BioY [Candidatus Bathyarchaeota archaeon]|nr:biotin transporter BioY [Candidatus Bathyarchaeota archaeon]